MAAADQGGASHGAYEPEIPADDAGGSTLPRAEPTANDEYLHAERRHVTVIFCDLVGSTALSARLDPEDLSHLLVAYRSICMDATAAFDGLVASFAGDGVMIYYGYPTAHEDDPLRAVMTGHRILAGVAAFNKRASSSDRMLTVRIGIAGGLVVVGEIGSGHVMQDRGVVGEAPNVAARIQGCARPGTVVVHADMAREVGQVLTCRSLGAFTLAGLQAPVELFEVPAPERVSGRLRHRRRLDTSRLVGREAERARLTAIWHEASRGSRVAVGVYGDAGVGKSRLLAHLRDGAGLADCDAAAQGALVLQCSPHHSSTAWHPWIDAFGHRLTRGRHSVETRLARLLNRHTDLAADLVSDVSGTLAALLAGDRSVGAGMESSQVRDAFESLLVALARRLPLLLVLEDAQWADPSTIDGLRRVFSGSGDEPMMLVVTARSARPLDALGIERRVLVEPLGVGDSAALLRLALNGVQVPEPWFRHLIAASDGNALHLEALALHVREIDPASCRDGEHDGPLDPESSLGRLPSSLQALFLSRLDRHTADKRLLQVAAVLGRRFSIGLLARLFGEPPDVLEAVLERLAVDGLVHRAADAGADTHEFHHALLRDAIYQSLLLRDRQHLHRRATEALLAEDPDSLDTRPELLAFHYTHAGAREQAIEAWSRAGLRAQRLSANTEAVEHFGQALKLVGREHTAERMGARLDLLVSQGPSMMAMRSWASAEVEALYRETIRLSRALDDLPKLFVGYRGAWGTAMLRGQMAEAESIAGRLTELAAALDNPALHLESRLCTAANRFWRGELPGACRDMRAVQDEYDPEVHRRHAYRFAVDPGVLSRFYRAITKWYLGHEREANRLMDDAVALAERHRHYPSVAWALGFQGWLAILDGRTEEAIRISRRSAAFCRTHDLPLYVAWAEVMEGSAILLASHDKAGLDILQEGLVRYRSVGAGVALPVFLQLRAIGEYHLDRLDTALASVREARAFGEAHGIGIVNADLWYLEGAIRRRAGHDNARRIDECFARADAEAAKQGKRRVFERLIGSAEGVRPQRTPGHGLANPSRPSAVDTT